MAAKVLLVPIHPLIKAHFATSKLDMSPLALLAPNSMTFFLSAALTILLLAVVYREFELKYKSNVVSINCASIIGALTVIIGSFGKITVPSGTA